jgi:phosphatidylserine decarboxylase
MNAPWSKRLIRPFIRDYAIKMEDFKDEDFKNFNQFFVRQLKPGVRPWVQGTRLAAFSEARYIGYAENHPARAYPVKGEDLAPQELLRDNPWAQHFAGGPILIARLCPIDYHRFHYGDEGRVLDHFRVPGILHSVNPVALKTIPGLFGKNEKNVTIIDSKNFGKLAMIEVGAMGVGKIVQTHLGPLVQRGEEKGYFLFGGSTVILLGEPQRWRPSEDILQHTANAQETYVHLGDEVAVAL